MYKRIGDVSILRDDFAEWAGQENYMIVDWPRKNDKIMKKHIKMWVKNHREGPDMVVHTTTPSLKRMSLSLA